MPKILLYRANRPALHFLPNDLIGSRSTGGHLEISSINNRRTATIFIRFLAYFPEANLSSTSLPSIFWKYSKTFHQQPENIQRLFISTRKYSKTFSPAILSWPQIINYIPEIFKDFLGSNQQQQPASAVNSSNQQQQQSAINSNQRQQPAAAISNNQPAATINQQQQSTISNNQPAATINQQQQSTSSNNQPAAAIKRNNQHEQRPALVLPAISTQSTIR